VPGGQAEYLRVPQVQFGPIKVPEGPPDERFLYLSDVLPTSWQAVEYANIPEGGSVTVFGLGPIGQMSSRIARHRGARVIGVDLVPERLEMARRHGIEVIDVSSNGGAAAAVRELTDGRGTGINLRMGQAHVKRWIDDLMPLVTDDSDPIGVEDLATHQLPLEEAPRGYEIFQKKEDDAIKVVLKP
jgi:threonine dehydrogenase-like Zn-dependent dehydrogenase